MANHLELQRKWRQERKGKMNNITLTPEQLIAILSLGQSSAPLIAATSELQSHSLAVGQTCFVQTATYAYTGRVVAVTTTDLVLAEAAWIADTGRLSDFILGNSEAKEVEPVDTVIVSRGAIVSVFPFPYTLPRVQK